MDVRLRPQIGQIVPQMGEIRDFFRSDLSTFWLTEPKCTNNWSEKSQISSIGVNLSHFGPKTDIPGLLMVIDESSRDLLEPEVHRVVHIWVVRADADANGTVWVPARRVANTQGCQVGSKFDQIGPQWEKCTKTDFKKSQICPNLGQSDTS